MLYGYHFWLGIVGFCIASFIRKKRVTNEKLVCVIGNDCNKVINSKYSRLFGVQNEVIGIIFYGLVVLYSLLGMNGIESIGPVMFSTVFMIGSGFAAATSLVLVYIQVAVIREWCEYCLASALVSIAVFLVHIL